MQARRRQEVGKSTAHALVYTISWNHELLLKHIQALGKGVFANPYRRMSERLWTRGVFNAVEAMVLLGRTACHECGFFGHTSQSCWVRRQMALTAGRISEHDVVRQAKQYLNKARADKRTGMTSQQLVEQLTARFAAASHGK